MLAGHITAPGRIELIDIPEPEFDPAARDAEGHGLILFQPEYGCLCGSDIPYFQMQLGRYELGIGHSLHEMVGTVLATSGTRFKPGDRVLAVPFQQRGLYERYILSEMRAIPLDPRPPAEVAMLAQPLGTVLFALKKLQTVIDLDVAVVGQGPIGQLFVAALRNLGAREIIAVDLLESRLKLSPRMGATRVVCNKTEDPVAVVHDLTDGRMADVVVEAVGHHEQALDLCASLCRRNGRILYFGVPDEHIERVRWLDLFIKNITVHTSVNPEFHRDFPLAMRWIGEGRLDVSPLITHRYPLREIQTAFETFRDRREGAIKVVIEFPSVAR